MIFVRSEVEIVKMRKSCQLAARTMEVIRDEVKPGITTQSLSDKALAFISSEGGKAAFLGYNGFPGAICASVNNEVVLSFSITMMQVA